MTGLFSRAFAQPLKLLGQTEASLSSYAVFWCVAYNEGSTQIEIARKTGDRLHPPHRLPHLPR